MTRKIEVEDYNPGWGKKFKEEAKKIKEIPKPIIDIMAVVKDISLGTAFGNTSLGMCCGISIGMCLGLAVGNARLKK